MEGIKITCLSIDCPERTGGECNALERMEEEKRLEEFDEKYPQIETSNDIKLFIQQQIEKAKEVAVREHDAKWHPINPS